MFQDFTKWQIVCLVEHLSLNRVAALCVKPILALPKLSDEPLRRKRLMKNHVYKMLELVGSSETSIEEAISTAVAQASKTVRNMDWFEVVHTRGHIENGKIGHYQVTLKIGFTLET